AVENRAIVGIALQRIGNIAIEEGNYTDAVKLLKQSIIYQDDALNRTNLAVAYLRLNQLDKAAEEAQKAIAIDPKYAGAHYILGNIYFTKEDYKSALPELEKVLLLAPDFESARALGLTYLYLKQPERAKLLFEEIQSSLKEESPDLHISFGQAYEQTNYPLESEREFKRALAINPKQPRASFFLGYVILQYGGADRLAEAAAAFEKELQLSPNDFYANFFAGVVASSENKHERAIQYLNKAAQISPKRGEIYLFLGQSQIELNDLGLAEKNLRLAIELEGSDTKAKSQGRRTHFLLGRLLLKTDRKAEGEKELAIAAKLQQESLNSARSEINQILGQVVENPQVKSNAEKTAEPEIKLPSERAAELKNIKAYLTDVLAQAYNNLGVIAVQNNDANGAIEKFSAALEWKPDFPNLNRNLGIVSFRANQFDKAIAPLSRHLQANSKDNLIRQMLGTSFYFMNNFAKAVETLKPIEAILTTDTELAYFYGISLVQLKRNQEAIPVFNKLALASQKTSESLFYAAQGFMILGDYERAVKEFRTVVSFAPETPKANYFIGQSLIRLNQYAQAEQFFKRELEINPADALSKYHLALTLIERKIETEKAMTILEEAINLRSDYADAHYQLGKIYLERGDTEKAIAQLESAVSSDAKKDYIHYQLSIAYRKMSRKDDADRELKLYQKLKADSRKPESPM
ncbi:MAG: tetratricopeptide repeat protein, partial [Acidobacteriota bacterium]|nr:tetratricopeptide repeat protein [Acidobacteriota bacterium]